VGHVFYFGTKYSIPLEAFVTDQQGRKTPVEMGSYGIGLSRLVAALIEIYHDDRGIFWPESVSPFDVGLLNLKVKDINCQERADDIYHLLQEAKVDVLYDDRNETPGVKFADMDLIGLPYQWIIGPKSLASDTIEVKQRSSGRTISISFNQALDLAFSRSLKNLFEER
jgi:prolyl-tRNA synthetase